MRARLSLPARLPRQALRRLLATHGEIFDEIYFAQFAQDDLKGIKYFDPEPPLAKLMIAAGEWLYGEWRIVFEGANGNPADLGFTPFGWRWMGSIFGTLCIPLMYLLAMRLWPNRLFAIAAATLTCFDGMFFIQSRIGMIDIFPIFFILLAYYVFHLHLQSKTPALVGGDPPADRRHHRALPSLPSGFAGRAGEHVVHPPGAPAQRHLNLEIGTGRQRLALGALGGPWDRRRRAGC